MRFATYISCFVVLTLSLGCQNQKSHQHTDPAAELQQAQVQPVQTPIPSSAGNGPIVIHELSQKDAAGLSDGMLQQSPQDAPAVTP